MNIPLHFAHACFRMPPAFDVNEAIASHRARPFVYAPPDPNAPEKPAPTPDRFLRCMGVQRAPDALFLALGVVGIHVLSNEARR